MFLASFSIGKIKNEIGNVGSIGTVGSIDKVGISLFFNVFSFNFNRTDKKMTSARSVASARSVTSAWSVVLILFFIIDFKGFTVATNYKNHRRWFEKMTGVALILCACRRPPHPTKKKQKNDITKNCNVGSIGTVGSIGKVGSSLFVDV